MDTETDKVPTSKPWVHLNGSLISISNRIMDETQLKPYPPRKPPQHTDSTLRFVVKMTGPSTWVLHSAPHQGFRQQLPPLLWNDESRAQTTYGGNGTNVLRNGTIVDIIFENDQGVDTQHPFHKHNHKAWIIGHGSGGFPFETVDEALETEYAKDFNLIDPPLRDGCRLDSGDGAWTVIRYEITFPAASMLHCHMIHHFAVSQDPILLNNAGY